MVNNRRTNEEVLEILRTDQWLDQICGWAVFDNVDGRWEFLGTSSERNIVETTEKFEYVPSIEPIVSSAIERIWNGEPMKSAGVLMKYKDREEGFLFFIPVGNIFRKN